MLLRLYNGYTWHRRTGTQLVLGFVLGDGRLTIQTLGTLAVIGCVSKLPQLHTVFVMFREKTAHIHTPTLAYSAPALAEAFTFGLALALALPCASGHVCRLSTLKCEKITTYFCSWLHCAGHRDLFHHFPCLGFDFGRCFCFRCSSLFFDTKRTEPIPFRHLVMEINRNPNNPIGPFQLIGMKSFTARPILAQNCEMG